MEEHYLTHWGMFINKSKYFGGRLYPKWLSRLQREQWDKQGMVVWDEDLQQLVNISGGFALRILEYLNTSEAWKETGIIIGEPATQIFIDHPERKSEHVLINQMHLDPEQTEELLVNFQSNISVLQEIEEMEKEEYHRIMAEVYSLILNFSAERKARIDAGHHTENFRKQNTEKD